MQYSHDDGALAFSEQVNKLSGEFEQLSVQVRESMEDQRISAIEALLNAASLPSVDSTSPSDSSCSEFSGSDDGSSHTASPRKVVLRGWSREFSSSFILREARAYIEAQAPSVACTNFVARATDSCYNFSVVFESEAHAKLVQEASQRIGGIRLLCDGMALTVGIFSDRPRADSKLSTWLDDFKTDAEKHFDARGNAESYTFSKTTAAGPKGSGVWKRVKLIACRGNRARHVADVSITDAHVMPFTFDDASLAVLELTNHREAFETCLLRANKNFYLSMQQTSKQRGYTPRSQIEQHPVDARLDVAVAKVPRATMGNASSASSAAPVSHSALQTGRETRPGECGQ